jgi:hypothetical protein
MKTSRFVAQLGRKWHPQVPPRWEVVDAVTGRHVATAWGMDQEGAAKAEAERLNHEWREVP